jgi:hypothetical protein
MFSSFMSSRNDIIFTTIDIANTTACTRLGASFARGPNRKYWLYRNFNYPIRWIEFVSDWANPISKEISQSEFELSLNSPMNGGSAFFFEIPNAEKNKLGSTKTFQCNTTS